MASKKDILKELSLIALGENIPVNHKLKALELMGKATGLFKESEEKITAVKIIDDVPKGDELL